MVSRGRTKDSPEEIIEPFILERMAAEVHQSTCAILESINKWILPDTDATSKVAKADDRIVVVQGSRWRKLITSFPFSRKIL